MRSDSDIKRDVDDELRLDPDIDATDIAVAVKNGVVTLTGFVRPELQPETSSRGRREAHCRCPRAGERYRGALARHQQEARSRDRT
jgi:hypothetical protein